MKLEIWKAELFLHYTWWIYTKIFEQSWFEIETISIFIEIWE